MTLALRHLRVFLAVVDHGSVTRASEALFRAQSAITRSIRELEDDLGVPLFERRAQGMLTTRYGEALERRARRVAGELQDARRELARLAGPARAIGNAPVFALLVNEKRLRAFVALTELHHMPSVAREIGITQPAVSAAVRELEDSLGVPLFTRSARGMQPSDCGDVLALHVKRALAELRHARDDVAALGGTTRGTVVVGALPLGRTLILPRAVARVATRHPGLHLATVEGPFATLAAALRAGDIDLILGALRPPSFATDLAGEALLRDELRVVVRADHPLLRGQACSLDAVARRPWVLPRAGAPTRDLIEALFAERGIAPPEVRVETSDLAVLRGLLLESDLVTAISPQQLHYEFGSGLLAALPIPLPETSREIGIIVRAGSVPSPGSERLIAEIRTVAREIAAARELPRRLAANE
ncbi:MAG: LysR family transcriptional regulator [Burkholderiales bacterium]